MVRVRVVTVLTVVVLVRPPAVVAQQPVAPSAPRQTNPIVLSFRAFSTRYGGWLLAAFDSIPATTYRYKPTPAQQTVGTVAEHLENANYELCALFSNMKPPAAAGDSVIADTIKAMWPKDTLIARLRESLVYCDSAMASLTDAALDDIVPLDPPSNRTIVRVRYLLAFVTDLAEHYSQIASYMRLNGMVPPTALPRPSH
jgi:hypothetical protein